MLLKILDFGMGIQEAIDAPGLSLHADPNFYKPGAAIKVRVEGRVAPEVTRDVVAKGHVVERTAAFAIGNMQDILKHPETGTMTAGADPRRTGYAVGW